MIASEMIQDIRREVLEISANFWSDDELLRLLNRGLQNYMGETRMLEQFAFLTTTPGERRYVLPSNVLSVKIVMYKASNEDGSFSWKRMTLTTLQRIAQEFPQFLNTTADFRGEPSQVAIYDRNLEFNKAPNLSVDSDLFIFYKARPSQITNTSQTIPLDDTLTESLNQFMLWKAWSKEKELALAREAKNEYFAEIRRGRRWVKKQAAMEKNRLDILTPFGFSTNNAVAFNPLNV